nr:transcription factor GTE12-like [Tanacetum cinerariifolium]
MKENTSHEIVPQKEEEKEGLRVVWILWPDEERSSNPNLEKVNVLADMELSGIGVDMGGCIQSRYAKVDPLNAQQTMEIIERKKLKEKLNIESRIRAARAAKEALLESAKSDLQLRRYKEREKVEKNSKIGDNLTFLRELEKMCQYLGNPLEKIGLRLKEEYYYGYEYSDDGNDIISDELEDGMKWKANNPKASYKPSPMSVMKVEIVLSFCTMFMDCLSYGSYRVMVYPHVFCTLLPFQGFIP